MNILILGNGKMGSLTAQVARERGHHVRIFDIPENDRGTGLTPENLHNDNVVIDFTTPDAAVGNIEGCARCGKSIVVGTTGWYAQMPRIREIVEKSRIGLLWGANFSIGVNLFLDASRAAAMALKHQYTGQIFERHHVHKKDAPSGTAVVLQRVVGEASGSEVEITSFREGEVVGMHELVLDSPNDTIYLSHNAKSRRGFADGAVRAAEWLPGKAGFFDFKDIWKEL